MSSSQVCAACGKTVSPDSLIAFWDGRSYCRECLNEVSEGLADYCATHDRLEETVQYSPVRHVAQLCVLVVPFLAVPIFFRSAVFAAPILVIIGIILSTALVGTQLNLPTVVARDGCVTVKHRLRWLNSRRPLEDCRWYVGSMIPVGILYLPRRALARRIVLCVPWGRKWVWSRVNCGFTPEARRLWEALLTLAKVPEGRPPLYRHSSGRTT